MELIEGIVLKTMPYQDNTKIAFILTTEGKQSVLVKGATNQKSRTFQYAQELIKVSFAIKGKYLITGKRLDSYESIRLVPSKLKSAFRIAEIAYELSEHINDAPLFYQFVADILKLINESIYSELLEVIFRIKTLYLLGLAPVFTECVDCHKKDDLVGFSLYGGGMKCKNCFQAHDLLHKEEMIDLLKLLYITKLPQLIPKLDAIQFVYRDVDGFLNLYYEHFLGFKSKVARIYSHL